MVVKNIGTGLAHDIKFEFSKPLPDRAFGLTLNEALKVEPIRTGPLINGIPALGPGEERKIDWGQYGGLLKNIGEEPIIATCRFKSNKKDMKPIICKLDIKSFEGTIAVTNNMTKISNEIKKIADSINELTMGSRNLRIEVIGENVKENKNA